MASPIPPGKIQFLDGNGEPLAGGQVFTYIPGTTTPKTTYQDFGGTTANSNPIELDANGEAVILGTGEYLMTVNDALGNLIWSQNTGVAQNTDLTDGSTSGSPLVISYLTITNTLKAAAANITGGATIGGSASVGANLTVTGTTGLTGALTAAAATFSGTVALNGTATATTPTTGDNTTNVATTAFVTTALADITLATSIYGLTTAYVTGTSFSVAAGGALSDDFSLFIPFASSQTKTFASFATGTGTGSLDTGTVANSTWYTVWLIRNPTTGVSDILTSTSATSPTLPSGYTKKVRIGALYNTSGGTILNYSQVGNEFLYPVGVVNLNGATLTTGASTLAMTAPAGVPGIRALFQGLLDGTDSASYATVLFRSPDEGNATPLAGQQSLAIDANGSANAQVQAGDFSVRTSTATINVYVNLGGGGGTTLSVYSKGFYYPRGLT